MEKVNTTPPAEEWRNKVQLFAMDLIEMRFQIDEGDINLINTYFNKLKAGLRILGIDNDTNVKNIIKEISVLRPFNDVVSDFSGESMRVKSNDYDTYMEKLDELDIKVRNGLRDNNYLIKIINSHRRLT